GGCPGLTGSRRGPCAPMATPGPRSAPARHHRPGRSATLGITSQAQPCRTRHDRRQVTAIAAPCSAWSCGFRCTLVGQAGAPRRNTPDRSGGVMAQTKARTSVKDKALYKRLRNLGVSVKESTRVANASAKTSRQKAGQRGGAATFFANWKVPELRRRAKKAGIKGRSTMNKKQLIKALRTS